MQVYRKSDSRERVEIQGSLATPTARGQLTPPANHRAAISEFRRRAVRLCNLEAERWGETLLDARDDPYCAIVGDYWRLGTGIQSRDGRTVYIDENGRSFRPAWSAAFVSYIYRMAGAGSAFHYAEAHIHYIVQAARDALCPRAGSAFFARDPASFAPRVGDLLCMVRERTPVTLANLEDHYGASAFPNGNFVACHADVVVNIDSDRRLLRTVGGNLAGRVGEKFFGTDREGRVRSHQLLCVIECAL